MTGWGRWSSARAWIAGLLVVLVLAGCGSEGVMERPQLGSRSEKRMYGALDAVNATDAERLAVLKAYDDSAQRMKAVYEQWRDIVHQWRSLDRAAPEYPAQLAALSARWAAVNGQEMQERGSFDHAVSGLLTAEQWKSWQAYMEKTEPYDLKLREMREREREREAL